MKKLAALVAALVVLAAATPARAQTSNVVRVAYYYKIKWGFQDEFERLFFKNHRPILAAQTKPDGRIRDVSIYRPRFHGDGRADWTFLVVISFADWAALTNGPDEAEIARGIFPDMETWRREEKRRFEIVEAHWDVPLAAVQPPK